MAFYCVCPGCGAKIAAEEEWLGQRRPCPHCQAQIFIRKDRRLDQLDSETGETGSAAEPELDKSAIAGIMDKVRTGSAKPAAAPSRPGADTLTSRSENELLNRFDSGRSVPPPPGPGPVPPEQVQPASPEPAKAGLKIREPDSACPECNHKLDPGARVCMHCGYNQETGRKLNTSKEDGARNPGQADREKIPGETPPASGGGCANKAGGFLGLLAGFIVWRLIGGLIGLLIAIFIVVPIATILGITLCASVQAFLGMLTGAGRK